MNRRPRQGALAKQPVNMPTAPPGETKATWPMTRSAEAPLRCSATASTAARRLTSVMATVRLPEGVEVVTSQARGWERARASLGEQAVFGGPKALGHGQEWA